MSAAQLSISGKDAPLSAKARAENAYSSTLSGPYCQPSAQLPPTSTPAGMPTSSIEPASPLATMVLPKTSSTTLVQ